MLGTLLELIFKTIPKSFTEKFWSKVYYWVKNNKKKSLSTLILFLLISLSLISPFSDFLPFRKYINKLMYCSKIDKSTLLTDTKPITSLGYHHWSESLEMVPTIDFKTTRYNQFRRSLIKIDSIISTKNETPYAKELILPLFEETSVINENIQKRLRSKKILYVHEDVYESNQCVYDLSLHLAKNSYQSVFDIIKLEKNIDCIQEAVDHELLIPLKKFNEVSIDLESIFNSICNCNDVRGIVEIRSECSDTNCKGLYFEKGEYKLTSTSETIFKCISNSLSKIKNDKLSIEFHGFADSSRLLGRINFDDKIRFPTSEDLLLGENDNMSLDNEYIDDNLELSYARAYSSLKFIKKLLKNNIPLFYTGHGVMENSDISLSQKRTVIIKIRKIN